MSEPENDQVILDDAFLIGHGDRMDGKVTIYPFANCIDISSEDDLVQVILTGEDLERLLTLLQDAQ